MNPAGPICYWSLLTVIWVLIKIAIGTTVSPECSAGNGNRNCTDEQSLTTRTLESCKVFGSCSQRCNDTEGQIKCSCIDGFKLEVDSRTCTAIDSEWKLLYLTSSRVGLRSGRKTDQKRNPKLPNNDEYYNTFLGIAYDARRNITFSSSYSRRFVPSYYAYGIPGYVHSFDSKESVETVADSGIGKADGIAFDWITENLYLADSKRNEIVVCKLGVDACSVLVTQHVNSAQDLVVHPNEGLMFWTNMNGNQRIIRADMDGKNFVTILQSNLKVINGLAIDQGSSRLYWIDSKFDKLESSLLDGRDRRIIIARKWLFPDAFIMDIFGDQVFWGNTKTDAVFSANKFTGSNVQPQFINQENDKLIKGRIFHVANQPISILNPCDEATCSHICVISPNSGVQFRCVCPVGMHIDPRDERTCVETQGFPKLAIACGTTVHLLPIGSIGKSLTEEILIPDMNSISDLVYNPVNNSLVLRDTSAKFYEFKLDGKTVRNIYVEDALKNIQNMNIDVVGGNLYWINTLSKTLEAMSLRTGATVVIKNGMEDVTTFAVTPETGSAFFTVKNENEQILYKIALDGSTKSVIQFLGYDKHPMFAIDRNTGKSYSYGEILPVSVDGSGELIGKPSSDFIDENNRIYVVPQMNVIRVKTSDFTLQYNVKYTTVGERCNVELALVNKTGSLEMRNLLYEHECSEKSVRYKQCSHVCVMSHQTNFQGECRCPAETVLGVDNKTCEISPTCNADQFRCHDKSCINGDLICDRFPDCSGWEDEANCKNQIQCPANTFHCGRGNGPSSCIPNAWVCDGTRHCKNGEDETCKKFSCASWEYYCEATDECVHKSWLCSRFNETNKFYECPGVKIQPSVDKICSDFYGSIVNGHIYHRQCTAGEFWCYDGNYNAGCIGTYSVCDNNHECMDGEDEIPSMCQGYNDYHRQYYG
ncbi:unnamed protein product [Orchesella dallaii]|uniref:EGF-like domain-containing protein n=1 Tax=Orchesella dallaii TaxID=48710 RepID=A0ABP1RAP0_9HEXA